MKHRGLKLIRFLTVVVASLTLVVGCGDVVVPTSTTDDGGGSTATTDADVTVAGDVAGDVNADNGPTGDVPPDVQPDVQPDIQPDTPQELPGDGGCSDASQCDDSDPCTVDSCANGACLHAPAANVCTIGGACYAAGANAPGDLCQVCDPSAATDGWTALTCSDDNPCTQDTCEALTGCDFPPDDAATCDDGKVCSGDDHCDAGECVGTCVCEVDSQCDGKLVLGPCERAVCLNYDCVATSDAAKDGQPCSEGNPCIDDGVCNLGACVGAEPKDCSGASDGPCKPGVCNPTNGQCVTDVAEDGSNCSDLDACTEGDQCINGACMGSPKDCSPFDGPCSTGGCQNGQCVPSIDSGQSCDPGNACVLDSTCTDVGACVGQWDTENCPCSVDSDCVDELSCTQAFCAQDSGACGFPLVPNSCLINNVCYFTGETNPATVCQRCDPAVNPNAWTEVACDDGNPCTEDACDGAQGCVGTPDDALSCNDGDPCTDDDHCEAGACVGECECVVSSDCVGADLPIPPRFCERAVCTNFKCVVVPDATKDGQTCDDGDACVSGEVCGAGSCGGGVGVVCDAPANSCTSVACNPATGTCDETYADAGTGCNDGDACTLDDACDGEGGCSGQLKDCSAFADQCNGAECVNGACIPAPLDGIACDDLEDCTIDDVCSTGSCGGAWNGSDEACGCNNDDSFCDDQKPCTINTCAPSGECITTVKAGRCLIGGGCFLEGDTNPQNACQTCNAQSGTSWQGIACDDGKACTDDACDPASGCTATNDDSNACSDGDACSSDDHCAAGACVGTCECTGDGDCTDTAPACQRFACVTFSCVLLPDGSQDGQGCEDGNYCSVNDSCLAGSCVSGGARDCSESANGDCTVGVCDEPSDACVTEIKPNNSSCDDAVKCTDDDKCTNGICAGVAVDCSTFADECNLGQCNPATGQCASVPTPGDECTDGDDCTLQDSCSPGGTCEGAWDDENCGCDGDDDCAGLTNTCNIGRCDVETHVCMAEPQEGTPCNDSEACTVDDQCNDAGVCAGSPYTCDDELGCTANVCDGQGGCTYPLQSQRCLIGGACYSAGQTNPANVCQICQDGTVWSANDNVSCDDGQACTKDDGCDAQQCAGVAYDCDDELACTTDTCLGNGSCTNLIVSSACVIGGVCYDGGAVNPNNPCQTCLPAQNKTNWTANSASCDDGNACTKGDICSGGTCGGTAYSCVDNQPCTKDNVCDGSGGCSYPLIDGWCRIGSVCVQDGVLRPGSECQFCDVASSTDDWTNKTVGTTCDDGLPCTSTSACNEGGACEGEIDGCNPAACEMATCTEGGCTITLRSGWCKIDGTCHLDGKTKPGDVCQRCEADTSPSAWTPVNGGTCDDNNACSKDDKCIAGQCTGSAYDCDSELWCVTTVCDGEGGCDGTTQDGSCLIGGACYQSGAYHPNNECLQCEPGTSQTSWTNRTGSCTDDGLSCTNDVCSSGQCQHNYTAINKECLIGGVCWPSAQTNPANSCQHCDYVNGPTAWSNKSSGSACDDDNEPCTDDECNSNGACKHNAHPDFEACSDGVSATYGDWCYNAVCSGFQRDTSHEGYLTDEEYWVASVSEQGGVHASYNHGCTGSFCFPGWAVDRYQGSLDPVHHYVGAGLAATPVSLNEEYLLWANGLSWYDSTTAAWALEGALNTEWSTLPTTAQFHSVAWQPASTFNLYAAGWNTETEVAFVRTCNWFIFSGWSCKDDPVQPGIADNLRNCRGWGEVGQEPFLGCEYWSNPNDAGPSYEYVLKFNPTSATWETFDSRFFGSTSGRTVNDFGSAGSNLVAVGDAGALVVTNVTAALGSGGDAIVSISGFGEQGGAELMGVANSAGRAWVIGSYIAGSPFQVQHLFVAHGDEGKDLRVGSNWSVRDLHTISSLCLIGVPCGTLGADYRFRAVAGTADELYIFGAWFNSSTDQRDKAAWRWALP